MKRIWFFLISGLLIFCTIGSRNTITSLDRAMIHAVGIDSSDGGYRVTLQVFRPDSAGTDTQLDPAKANIFIVSADAPTVDKAMTECENRLGEFLFIGHNQLIVLGSGVGLEQSAQLFSCFIKSKESYLGAKVVCAENASKLLSAELSEGIVSAQSLVGIIERHAENADTVECDLLNAFGADSGTTVLPELALTESSENEGEQTVSASGAAVYINGRRSFSLSAEKCAGLGLLLGKCSQTAVLAGTDSGAAAVDVQLESSSARLVREGSGLKCCFDISVSVQDDQSIELLFDKARLRFECEKTLQESCGRILELCREKQADLIGLSDMIRSRYPQVWLDCGGDFRQLISLTELSAEVNADIRE